MGRARTKTRSVNLREEVGQPLLAVPCNFVDTEIRNSRETLYYHTIEPNERNAP